jgi:hypothetical protein
MDFKWRSCLPLKRGRSFAEFALRALLEGLRMTYSVRGNSEARNVTHHGLSF